MRNPARVVNRISAFSSFSLAIGVLFIVGCTAVPSPEPVGRSAQAVDGSSYTVPGNPTCADLGYAYEHKIEPPETTTELIDGSYAVSIDVAPGGIYFDWTSALPIDAVIVKGGPNAEVYELDPEGTEGFGLSAPFNAGSGGPYGLSHVSFCYDYELVVAKDAETSFEREWDWTIDKSSSVSELLLSAGQTYLVGYDVVVSPASWTDGNFAVSGTITITNPDPSNGAEVVSVEDVLSDGTVAAVSCEEELPVWLGPGETLSCAYEAALADGSTLTNTATAETPDGSLVGSGSGEATVDFASATVSQIDECVTVEDDLFGPLGLVCAGGGEASFSYSLEVGPYAGCGGSHEVVNLASFVANDTGASGSDSWTVGVEVAACDAGCSLTPGYWKTHSPYGPAPYDDAWALLPSGADTPFFLSGKSYHDALWTAPRGNAYYVLAHAYVAAELNGLNGADLADAQAAFDAATALFEAYTPGEIGALSGNRHPRGQFLAAAGVLDSYNNGLIGPGHCSEEAPLLAD